MSDYTTYRDSERTTLIHRIAAYIAKHGPVRTTDLYAAFPHEPKCSVKRVPSELRILGFVRADRIAGAKGQGSNKASWWSSTAMLRRTLDAGQPVKGKQRVATRLEDDGWTPPTQYIGGTRAVILGLRRRRDPIW